MAMEIFFLNPVFKYKIVELKAKRLKEDFAVCSAVFLAV